MSSALICGSYETKPCLILEFLFRKWQGSQSELQSAADALPSFSVLGFLLQQVLRTVPVKLLAVDRILHHVDVVVPGVLLVMHAELFHHVNRCGVRRLGDRHDAFELMRFKSESETGPCQFRRQTFTPMRASQVIDDFGRAEQRSQSTKTD